MLEICKPSFKSLSGAIAHELCRNNVSPDLAKLTGVCKSLDSTNTFGHYCNYTTIYSEGKRYVDRFFIDGANRTAHTEDGYYVEYWVKLVLDKRCHFLTKGDTLGERCISPLFSKTIEGTRLESALSKLGFVCPDTGGFRGKITNKGATLEFISEISNRFPVVMIDAWLRKHFDADSQLSWADIELGKKAGFTDMSDWLRKDPSRVVDIDVPVLPETSVLLER